MLMDVHLHIEPFLNPQGDNYWIMVIDCFDAFLDFVYENSIEYIFIDIFNGLCILSPVSDTIRRCGPVGVDFSLWMWARPTS